VNGFVKTLQESPELAAQALRRLLGFAVACAFAIALGYWVGTERRAMLYIVGGLLVFAAVTLGLRQRAWALIIAAWWFGSNTLLLPIPFSLRDIAVMLAFGAYVGIRVMTRADMRQKLHPIDWIVAINLAYLAFTFLQNPVGFRATGSETYGGRTYLNVFIATMAYWVIVRMPQSVKMVSRIPYYLLWGAVAITVLHIIAYVFPQITVWLYFLYSGLDVEPFIAHLRGVEGGGRLKGLAYLGQTLVPLLCAYYEPLTLFDPRRGRFYALLLGMVSILLSGFRATFLRAAMAIGIGAWLHRGLRHLAAVAAMGCFLLALLIAGQGKLYQLPHSVQRTLTFLPGDWSLAARLDAGASSEWRFDLWKMVVEQRLIKNWWLGDGFGIRAAEMASFSPAGAEYTERTIIEGAYHSGPLTAIRYVGIVGMILFYAMMIMGAVYSYKCVNACRGTLLQPIAIFLAIHLMWQPIHFTFIFGGYNGAISEFIFQLALLRLVIRFSQLPREKLLPQPSRPTVPAAPVPA
jgi:hypothetical protein